MGNDGGNRNSIGSVSGELASGQPASGGPVETEIRQRLGNRFAPIHLELSNESHMHSVAPGSETHFRLVLVSQEFSGLSRIARQRAVNEALADLMRTGGVHALTQKTLSPEEWEALKSSEGFVSPPCLGGSKADQPD
jgi:stress-induced morphogen